MDSNEFAWGMKYLMQTPTKQTLVSRSSQCYSIGVSRTRCFLLIIKIITYVDFVRSLFHNYHSNWLKYIMSNMKTQSE